MSVGCDSCPASAGSSKRTTAFPGRASSGTRTGPWYRTPQHRSFSSPRRRRSLPAGPPTRRPPPPPALEARGPLGAGPRDGGALGLGREPGVRPGVLGVPPHDLHLAPPLHAQEHPPLGAGDVGEGEVGVGVAGGRV